MILNATLSTIHPKRVSRWRKEMACHAFHDIVLSSNSISAVRNVSEMLFVLFKFSPVFSRAAEVCGHFESKSFFFGISELAE